MNANLQFIFSSVFFIFVRHIYLLCGLLCGAGGALSIRKISAGQDIDRSFTAAEIKKASFSFFLAVFIPFFLSWLLQFSSGQVMPFPETWTSPQRELGEILWTLCYLSLFIWIWFLKGTHSVSKYVGAMWRSSDGSVVFKIIQSSFFLKLSTLVLLVSQLFDTVQVLSGSQMGLL